MTGAMPQQAAMVSLSAGETADLKRFAELVLRWNPKINLISKSTVADIWDRHVIDSAQIYQLAPESAQSWADIGSGGGFPGIVVAILAAHRHPERAVTLVESDQRKAVFLRQAVRELGLRCTVLCRRIEQISDFRADVVSARALAPLAQLLALAVPLLGTDGTCLFSKGAGRQQEIDEARRAWRFMLAETVSVTDSGAAILKITDMHHV